MATNSNINQLLAGSYGFERRDTEEIKKDLRGFITPVQLTRLRQDISSWRDSVKEAENAWYPHRVKQQQLYIDTRLNGHVIACMNRRRDMTLLRKWEFVDSKGNINEEVSKYFLDYTGTQSQNKKWFNDYLVHAYNALFYGYSLISLGDIENDSFPNLSIIKRWNISPDRLNVTGLVYSLSGALFLQEPYEDWHVWVNTIDENGISKCGYGILYEVALYEIYMRNLLGQNADFTEMFAQPFRVGKTTKQGDERNMFYETLKQMGSAGFMVSDPDDNIDFLESKLGGTGYRSYSEFNSILQSLISKIILGHADALDSVAGKLGNDAENSPANKALQDKQTIDSMFICNYVNVLIGKMRKHGFNIPDDVRAVLKNDIEITKNQNNVIAQAVEIKKAGLQIDPVYFEEKTGIKLLQTTSFQPIQDKTEVQAMSRIKNKLSEIYSLENCNCGKH